MSQPFPQRRPLLFIGLLLFLILGIFLITFAVTALGHWPVTAASLISEILLGLVAVFLLSRFQWWHVAGFRMPRYSPAFLCLLAPCFVLVTDANTVSQYWDYLPGRNNALFFAIFAMLVGFVEENYFRGLILRTLLVRGPWLAAIVSSVVFGAMHLLHLIEGQNLVATVSQAIWATALGFLFAAVALRTQSILPLIIIHGLIDFVAFLALNGTVITYTPSSGDVTETVVEVLVYVTLGIIAMRGIHTPDLEPDPDGRDGKLVEVR